MLLKTKKRRVKMKKFIIVRLNGWKAKTERQPKNKGIIKTSRILLFRIKLII